MSEPNVWSMDGGKRTRILVADHNRLVVEALGALFEELVDLAEVTLAQSLDDAVEAAIRDQPDLVVFDAWLGDLDAAASIRKLLAASPHSSVVVIATKVDGALATALEQAGAAGFYEKESLPTLAHGIVAKLAGAR